MQGTHDNQNNRKRKEGWRILWYYALLFQKDQAVELNIFFFSHFKSR